MRGLIVLVVAVVAACGSSPPAEFEPPSTTDLCAEVEELALAYRIGQVEDLEEPTAASTGDSLFDEVERRRVRARHRIDAAARQEAATLWSAQNLAVLAEHHPDCFSPAERVAIEARYRELARLGD